MAKVQLMDRSDTETLGQYDSLFVKQTKKGCVQECFGCEATNEFKIYPSAADAKGTEIYYSLEESEFCMRFFAAKTIGLSLRQCGRAPRSLTAARS